MENDHRRLGRELGLFATDTAVGAGLPLWLPDGAVIRAELERFAMEEALRSGCQRVYTPVLAKRELYERSGHWAKFSADMFPPMRVGGEEFVLRPANVRAVVLPPIDTSGWTRESFDAEIGRASCRERVSSVV